MKLTVPRWAGWPLVIAIGIVPLLCAAYLLLRPPQWVLRALEAQNPSVLFRVDTDEKVVALTIDDAPHPEVTPAVLEVLERNGVRATFFVIGANAEAHPNLVEDIRSGGHELANHMYTDRASVTLSDAVFLDELERTEQVIGLDSANKWCRPGGGFLSPRIVRLMESTGYRCSLASAYPLDTRLPAFLARWQFLINVRPGAILVLHDGRASRRSTADVLAQALPRILDDGYRVVTLSELVSSTHGQ